MLIFDGIRNHDFRAHGNLDKSLRRSLTTRNVPLEMFANSSRDDTRIYILNYGG